MDTKQLTSFMCGGVASKVDSAGFWTGLETLRTEWQMDTKQLVSFMCGGVASKIDSAGFWTGLETLRTEWQMDTKQLTSFMCDGVASKIDSDRFVVGMRQLRDGIGQALTLRLMRKNDSFVRHIVSPQFVDAVIGIVRCCKEESVVPMVVFRAPYVCKKETMYAIYEALCVPGMDVKSFINSCRVSPYRSKQHRVVELLSRS